MIKKSFFYPFTALILAGNLFVGCQPKLVSLNDDTPLPPPNIIPSVTEPAKENSIHYEYPFKIFHFNADKMFL